VCVCCFTSNSFHQQHHQYGAPVYVNTSIEDPTEAFLDLTARLDVALRDLCLETEFLGANVFLGDGVAENVFFQSKWSYTPGPVEINRNSPPVEIMI
jgi:hypothetical protein